LQLQHTRHLLQRSRSLASRHLLRSTAPLHNTCSSPSVSRAALEDPYEKSLTFPRFVRPPALDQARRFLPCRRASSSSSPLNALVFFITTPTLSRFSNQHAYLRHRSRPGIRRCNACLDTVVHFAPRFFRINRAAAFDASADAGALLASFSCIHPRALYHVSASNASSNCFHKAHFSIAPIHSQHRPLQFCIRRHDVHRRQRPARPPEPRATARKRQCLPATHAPATCR
jgi:hypothetical protein